MKAKYISIPLLFFLILVATALSCKSTTPTPEILVEKQFEVPPGGNTAEVVFNAKEGQRIRISLQAKGDTVEPYGYLTFPDGNGDYFPKLENQQDGKNTAELTLPQTGAYTLAIMDGSNQGGLVEVKVEVLE